MENGPSRSAEYVTLRDYIDSRFSALEKTLKASDKASDYRLERMNEFRAALEDQTKTYVTKSEIEAVSVQLSSTQRQLAAEENARLQSYRDYASCSELKHLSEKLSIVNKQMNMAIGALFALQIIFAATVTLWNFFGF